MADIPAEVLSDWVLKVFGGAFTLLSIIFAGAVRYFKSENKEIKEEIMRLSDSFTKEMKENNAETVRQIEKLVFLAATQKGCDDKQTLWLERFGSFKDMVHRYEEVNSQQHKDLSAKIDKMIDTYGVNQ